MELVVTSPEASVELGGLRGPSRKAAKLQLQLDNIFREDELDWDKVRELMCGYEETLNPNFVDRSTGMETSHRAAYDGELDVLKWCIDKGADVNARNAIGRAPLHYACNGNRVRCIRLLLDNGADVNILSLALQTPLHLCCMYTRYEAALELLHGATTVVDVDTEDSRRMTAEAMTSDKLLKRAIRKYRATLDERRKADLLEQAIRRISGMYLNGSSSMTESGFEKFQNLLEQHAHGSRGFVKATGAPMLAESGHLTWEDFKEIQVSALQSQAVAFQDLMQGLHELEAAVFKETIAADKVSAEVADEPRRAATPRLSDASVVSTRRSGGRLMHAGQSIMRAIPVGA